MKTKKKLVDINELLRNVDRYFFWSADEVRQFIRNAPIVDAVEVVHGRWSDIDGDPVDENYCGYNFMCSECGFIYRFDDPIYLDEFLNNFCPNCGANMRGKCND